MSARARFAVSIKICLDDSNIIVFLPACRAITSSELINLMAMINDTNCFELIRQFRTAHLNVLWGSEFTRVATWSGFVDVAFVIDVFARHIVGWRASRSAQTGFVLDALEQALHERRSVGGLIHHPDRG